MIDNCPYCDEPIEPDIEGTTCDRCLLAGCEICMPDGLCVECVRAARADRMAAEDYYAEDALSDDLSDD